MVTVVCNCGLKKEDLQHPVQLLRFFIQHKHYPGTIKLVCSCGAEHDTGPILLGDDWTLEKIAAQGEADREWVDQHRIHGTEN